MEERIKDMIISKYGSVSYFAKRINLPYTTVDTILKRGLSNSNVVNVIKICNELDLDIDKVLNGEIVSKDSTNKDSELEVLFDKNKDILTDGDIQMIKFIVEQRKKEIDKELYKE